MFLPAAVWLWLCTVAAMRGISIPTWVMGTAWGAGVVFTGWTSGVLAGVISVVTSGFVFLVFALTGVVRRATTVSVIPMIAALPPGWGWVPFAVGLLLLGVVSLFLVWRSFGGFHVGAVTMGTFRALGVGSANPRLFGVGKPDLASLPFPEHDRSAAGGVGAGIPRVPVPLTLAAVTTAMCGWLLVFPLG